MRLLLLLEAAVFALAASAHLGWTVTGYEHARAATAESVIAVVLLLGFVWATVVLERTQIAGLVVQIFALLGTLVGVFVVIIGVGPQTVADVIYHVFMLVLLSAGIVMFLRHKPATAVLDSKEFSGRSGSPRTNA